MNPEPLYSPEGELLPEALDSLPYRELKNWFRLRLNGQDPAYAGHSDDSPGYVVAVSFQTWPRTLQDNIAVVLLEVIHDLALNNCLDWEIDALEEALSLIDPILLHVRRPGNQQLLDDLLSLAGGCGTTKDADRLAFRSLQGLLALEHRLSPAYWQNIWQTGGTAYLPLVMQGLLATDLREGLRWLVSSDWSMERETMLLRLLPGLIEKHGTGDIRGAIAPVYPSLPRTTQLLLEEYAGHEGFSFVEDLPIVSSDDLLSLADDLLSLVTQSLAGSHSPPEPATGDALATLTAILPRLTASPVADSRRLAETSAAYGSCLHAALRHSTTAAFAYQQLVSDLPPAEATQITHYVLSDNLLPPNKCAAILSQYYAPADVLQIVERTETFPEPLLSDQSRAQALTDRLGAFYSTGAEVYHFADLLAARDRTVPRDERAFLTSLLTDLGAA